MSLIPFSMVAAGAGALALLVRRDRTASGIVGAIGLATSLVLATGIRADEPVAIGGVALAGSSFARIFLVLGSATGLLLLLVGAAADEPPDVAPATLLALAASALALGSADPFLAVLAATVAGLAAMVTAAPRAADGASTAGAARLVRVLGVGGGAALTAVALTSTPLEDLAVDPAVVGIALLAVGFAVAIRFGAIPFHRWAALVGDGASESAVPLVVAWTPAVLAVVVTSWTHTTVTALAEPLAAERGMILAVALLTLCVGTAAAALQDDLGHVLAYSIVAEAGVALLALGALEPDAWAPLRGWLLAFLVAKSALAAWILAVRVSFGTRRLRDLEGWARRSPGLAAGLVIVAVATVGWPGLAAWEARGRIGELALGQPLAAIVPLASLGALVYLGRIALVGTRRMGATAWHGSDGRPAWPRETWPRETWPRGAGPRAVPGSEPEGRGAARLQAALRAIAADARRVGEANRVSGAIAGAAALGILALAIGAGSFGIAEAAAAPPPQELASPSPAPAPSAAAPSAAAGSGASAAPG